MCHKISLATPANNMKLKAKVIAMVHRCYRPEVIKGGCGIVDLSALRLRFMLILNDSEHTKTRSVNGFCTESLKADSTQPAIILSQRGFAPAPNKLYECSNRHNEWNEELFLEPIATALAQIMFSYSRLDLSKQSVFQTTTTFCCVSEFGELWTQITRGSHTIRLMFFPKCPALVYVGLFSA